MGGVSGSLQVLLSTISGVLVRESGFIGVVLLRTAFNTKGSEGLPSSGYSLDLPLGG